MLWPFVCLAIFAQKNQWPFLYKLSKPSRCFCTAGGQGHSPCTLHTVRIYLGVPEYHLHTAVSGLTLQPEVVPYLLNAAANETKIFHLIGSPYSRRYLLCRDRPYIPKGFEKLDEFYCIFFKV